MTGFTNLFLRDGRLTFRTGQDVSGQLHIQNRLSILRIEKNMYLIKVVNKNSFAWLIENCKV